MSDGVGMLILVLLACLLLGGACVAWPQYNVYSSRLAGEAQLRQAESNRKIAELEAQAAVAAAKDLAERDRIRAQGTADANEIISGSITDGYLKWFFIEQLDDGNCARYYVPTEAGIPILEAGTLD